MAGGENEYKARRMNVCVFVKSYEMRHAKIFQETYDFLLAHMKISSIHTPSKAAVEIYFLKNSKKVSAL